MLHSRHFVAKFFGDKGMDAIFQPFRVFDVRATLSLSPQNRAATQNPKRFSLGGASQNGRESLLD
jgi:hypothetical protein